MPGKRGLRFIRASANLGCSHSGSIKLGRNIVVSTEVTAVADKPNLLAKVRDISQLLTRINSYCALHKARFLCHTEKSHDSTVVQKAL